MNTTMAKKPEKKPTPKKEKPKTMLERWADDPGCGMVSPPPKNKK